MNDPSRRLRLRLRVVLVLPVVLVVALLFLLTLVHNALLLFSFSLFRILSDFGAHCRGENPRPTIQCRTDRSFRHCRRENSLPRRVWRAVPGGRQPILPFVRIAVCY